MDTNTDNLGLLQMEVGSRTDTWATVLNQVLAVIDQSISGRLVETLSGAGTTNAPNDLDIGTLNSDTDTGRYPYIEIAGADFGGPSYVRVTPNTAKKIAIVKNSLSGGQDLYIFQGDYSASNDYVLQSGESTLLVFDGAGTGATVVNAINQLKDLLVAGGVTIKDTSALLSLTNTVDSETATIEHISRQGNGFLEISAPDGNIKLTAGAKVFAFSPSGNLSIDPSSITGDNNVLNITTADDRYARKVAFGRILGFADDISFTGDGCTAVIATDGTITVTNTDSVADTSNMVITATPFKWYEPTNNPLCFVTCRPTAVNTWEARVYNNAGTQVTKAGVGLAGISLYAFTFIVARTD